MTSGTARRDIGILGSIAAVALIAVMAQGPIPQSIAYHFFADARLICGVPNFWNVASNLPFLVVGVAGLMLDWRRAEAPVSAAWRTAFFGCAMVFFGSAWYHLAPDDQSLLWDRLPIAAAFMGLFVAVLQERIHAGAGRLLIPFVLLGIGSVLWWAHSNDLRLYIWVQGSVVLLLPVVLALTWNRAHGARHLAAAVASYIVAKVFEFADNATFVTTAGFMGGHAIKHVLAASAMACAWFMLRDRNRESQARNIRYAGLPVSSTNG